MQMRIEGSSTIYQFVLVHRAPSPKEKKISQILVFEYFLTLTNNIGRHGY